MLLIKISKRKAALFIGLGIILMALIAPVAEFAILSENIDIEDLDQTKDNMEDNRGQMVIAFLIYVVVLALDILVGIGVYIYFRAQNKKMAMLAAGLRIVYGLILIIGLIGLLIPYPAMFVNGQLISYVFFIPHLLVLGHLAYKSNDVPRIIGGILMLGSFCYIYLTYAEYLISGELHDVIFMILMVPAIPVSYTHLTLPTN